MRLFRSRTLLRPLLLAVLVSVAVPLSAQDLSKPLRQAQQLLSDGQYDESYAAFLRFATGDQNPLAMFTVALFHEMGWGRPPDGAAACDWHAKAAVGDIPAASQKFAQCLQHGIGRPANPAAAAPWYRKAAELGIHSALCELGWLHMRGEGVEKKPAEAVALCSQSAQRGAVGSMFEVARMLSEGDSSVRDPAAAAHWFSQAGQRGSAVAAYRYGIMLRDGTGVAKNPAQAAEWLEAAGAAGYVPSYLAAGEHYLSAPPDARTGKPADRAVAKAYLWLSAAERASKDATNRQKASQLLIKVKAIMPATWAEELNRKVEAHLQAHPPG